MKRILSVFLVVLLLVLSAASSLAASDTGSITINGNDTFSLAGRGFSAYKILDVTLNTGVDPVGAAYTVPAAMQGFYTDYFSITETAGTSLYDQAVSAAIGALDAEEMELFAKAALAAAKDASITPETTTGTSANEAAFSDIPLGYYVIEDTTAPGANNVVSAVMIDTTQPDVEIAVKATLPTVDKKILDTDAASVNEASIGDTVTFQLTSAVPDMTGYNHYYFVLTDTPSEGLTLDEDSIVVKIGGTTIDSSEYTVKMDAATGGMRIVFKDFLQYKGQKGDAIVVTYDAVLNEDAAIGTPNENTATITYSNNPGYDYDSNKGSDDPDDPEEAETPPPTGETAESKTKTYTTSLTVNKEADDGEALTGAEFTLTGDGVNIVLVTEEKFTEDTAGTYYLLGDGTYSTTEPAGYTGLKYKKETVITAKGEGKTETTVSGMVDADGKITFSGLGAGEYVLTETKVPAGYNGIDPIGITITFDAATETFDATGGDATVTDNLINVTVVNKAGSLLPSTGGIGTTIFYWLGGILALGAVILLIVKKRMINEK